MGSSAAMTEDEEFERDKALFARLDEALDRGEGVTLTFDELMQITDAFCFLAENMTDVERLLGQEIRKKPHLQVVGA